MRRAEMEGVLEEDESMVPEELEKICDSLHDQHEDLFNMINMGADDSLFRLLKELRESEEGFSLADDEEERAVAKERCEALATELANKIESAEVLCHNIMVDLDQLQAEALEDYTVRNAK